jgi:hypothetical protein
MVPITQEKFEKLFDCEANYFFDSALPSFGCTHIWAHSQQSVAKCGIEKN